MIVFSMERDGITYMPNTKMRSSTTMATGIAHHRKKSRIAVPLVEASCCSVPAESRFPAPASRLPCVSIGAGLCGMGSFEESMTPPVEMITALQCIIFGGDPLWRSPFTTNVPWPTNRRRAYCSLPQIAAYPPAKAKAGPEHGTRPSQDRYGETHLAELSRRSTMRAALPRRLRR